VPRPLILYCKNFNHMPYNSDAQDEQNKKIPKQRSEPYPAFTLDSNIKFVEKIYNAFTDLRYTLAEDISKTLNQSGGNFLTQLACAVQYGLLEKNYSKGYKPTPLFKKIYKPTPNENVRDAQIEAFSKPPLYSKLIDEFRNSQLPSEAGLQNILDRNYGIIGNACITAAKVFFKNLAALGLNNEANILKFDNYIPFVEDKNDASDESGTENKMQILIPINTQGQSKNSEILKPKIETKDIAIVLKGEERGAKLTLPSDYSTEDLKRVIKILEVYLE
jgi:hypothetical protein